jgi:hypothetical protein
MSVRTRVRLALRYIGLERVRIDLNRIRRRSFVDLIHHEGISTVLDVGVKLGQYAKELRLLDYTGRIVSFELISVAYHGLASAVHGDWEARHLFVPEGGAHTASSQDGRKSMGAKVR